ncbi:MAG: CPBP family glutamic-type intramembrane protease [Parabacteroides sp.]|nr:CPBP family glutamic-type intramembrane protease [Parabacteroides sp.]
MADMKNGVLALDKRGKVIYSNPQMSLFFESESLDGQTIHSLMYENENPANDMFWDVILDVIHGHAIHYQKKVSYTAPSGREYKFHIISSYLSGDIGGIVITITDETEHEVIIQKKHDTTLVLISMLLVVCMTVLVAELHEFLDGIFPHDWIARSTEMAGVFFLVIALKYTSLTLKDFGIVPQKVWKELFESLLVVAVMVAAMAVAKMIMITNGSALFQTNRPFFDFTAPPDFYYMKYIAVVFLQEVVTKCGIQKSIFRILDNKYATPLAIAVTSLMFMAIHVQHGLVYMLGAGILNAVLAVMYSRYNSLLGCGIVHYSFGIFGLVLGWIV